ncbi:MAG: hypothetical protein HY458_00130 [Parcubacteria group bacterium]|nr:hypothetical protein [Parcubacteria group bacterium]
MNNRRLVDITPRSGARQKPPAVPVVSPVLIPSKPQKPRRKLPRSFVLSALALCLVFVSVLGIHLFAAKATIRVTPDSREVFVEQEVLAAKKEAILPAQAGEVIEALPLTKQQDGTRLFSATGKSSKQGQARGVITVYNTRPSTPQILVANTRFVSQDGKLFRSTARVVIQGAVQGGDPGSLNVDVVAAEAGEDYNIGPSSFSLPGLAGSVLYTAIYGKSSAPMTGGSKSETTVVAQDDLDRGKDMIATELREQAKQELRKQLPAGYEIPEDAFLVESSQTSSLAKAGAELSQFNVTGKVRVLAIAFSRSALNDFLSRSMQKELSLRETILERTVQSGYTFKNVDHKKGALLLAGFSKGKAYATVQKQDVALRVQGKAPDMAIRQGEATEGVKNLAISLWPFWEWRVPTDLNRINVSLGLDSL